MAEPSRKSMYDVLKHNLKVAERKTYLHRYYYFGLLSQNTLVYDGVEMNIGQLYVKIVKSINEDYCHETLSGIVILAMKYFVVVIDGSEDSLIKHFVGVFTEAKDIIVAAKLITCSHHIGQRFFDVFDYKEVVPPTLMEKINPDSDLEETTRQIDICVRKLFYFCANIRQPSDYAPSTIGELTSDLYQYLPECNLLEFIIKSKYPQDISEVMRKFHVIPKMIYYTERIWPVRDDFVPYDVFDKDKNPVPILPGQERDTRDANKTI